MAIAVDNLANAQELTAAEEEAEEEEEKVRGHVISHVTAIIQSEDVVHGATKPRVVT